MVSAGVVCWPQAPQPAVCGGWPTSHRPPVEWRGLGMLFGGLCSVAVRA